MEEKERYKYYTETNQIYDSEEDELYAYNLNNNKIISMLNQQDKRIKELEQDKTKVMDLLNSMTENWWILYEKNKKLRQENQQLKQQLDEKEKELSEYVKIVDDLHKQLSDKCDFCDKTKDQDKILFAVEQLEKVKGLIANHTQELWTCENDDIDLVLYEEINNQINELKGEVEDD